MKITKAGNEHTDGVASLFDLYRQFYRQNSDIEGAHSFMSERLQLQDSTIFIAEIENKVAGFVQLYPSFSSVGMKRTFILNDLFVSPAHRGKRVATCLLDKAVEHGKQSGVQRLSLATEIGNESAQALYEKLGWQKQTEYFYYSISVGV